MMTMDIDGPSDHRADRTRGKEDYVGKIRQLRDKAGFTQKQLAEQLKVGRGAVARWELGDREPDERNYLALAAFAQDRGLRELGDFFRARTERRRNRREQNYAERYLTAVEKDAAKGLAGAQLLLQLSRMDRSKYYGKLILGLSRARTDPDKEGSLALAAANIREAWRVTMLQLGRLCRDKRNEEARLRAELEP
jgi:transcriptional regulator with XRE-family HTH domain